MVADFLKAAFPWVAIGLFVAVVLVWHDHKQKK